MRSCQPKCPGMSARSKVTCEKSGNREAQSDFSGIKGGEEI
jgi:hypothetical protein